MFKHNISFGEDLECVRTYNFTDKSVLDVVYRSKTIHNSTKKGIKNYKDITDKVEPFVYYLASKYLKRRELSYEYEIRFEIGISSSEHRYQLLMDEYYLSLTENYKLKSYMGNKNIEIVEKVVKYFDGLLTIPFEIVIKVYENILDVDQID